MDLNYHTHGVTIMPDFISALDFLGIEKDPEDDAE